MSKVTERIDLVLKERGISKKEFYEKCGVTSAAYSQWNTGKTEPRGSTLRRVSMYLDVNYEWLCTGEGEKEKAPTNDGERVISDAELKFALWGDCDEISDEDLADVRRYAAFVRERKKDNKK